MPSHNIIRLNKHSKSSYLYSCLHSFLHRFVETIRKFWSISCSLVFYYTRETKGNRFQNLDVPRNNGRVEPFFRSETKGRILKVWQPTKDLENPSSRIPPTVTTDSCLRVMPRTGIKREACRRCSSVDGNKWTKEPTRNGERKEERERERRCAKTCRCHDRDFCACISLFSFFLSLAPPSISSRSLCPVSFRDLFPSLRRARSMPLPPRSSISSYTWSPVHTISRPS